MHTDLLDTVLVSQNASALVGDSGSIATASMKEPKPDTAAAGAAEERCPVDHKTREMWLQQARATSAAAEQSGKLQTPPAAATATATATATAAAGPLPTTPNTAQPPTSTWSSWLRSPFGTQQRNPEPTTTTATPTQTLRAARPNAPLPLGEDREVSSIPRSSTPGPSSCPSNHEQETGASVSGNWVYPSEKMFFDAMKRKGYGASAAADMKTVVPIHNAVNERAWGEILRWEAPYVAGPAGGSSTCGGPRLHSFAGLSERMSPRARLNTLLGYTAPFDRHDWVVDRCGTRVEYIIDFYAGRNDASGPGKLNFYLDVRPKLNTWEGVKMRALRATGLA
ncbi:cytochrome c/c1 heme-lyase [Lasiosphaeria miniovina]|uniref:Holocytochrome c-type synthase n=1 Tax=Lasiosphaeria miniovina TaxID=1954250 RepID=A0AA40DR28_9PEZI|nr:cytochrome c/c1 heme-lyase [Lasiosphaeria miniovina]KAK0712385.1 cytochrome c/c1 heme-lyase [Lasiosphaeria miniovina]